jgi:hypothetical protein
MQNRNTDETAGRLSCQHLFERNPPSRTLQSHELRFPDPVWLFGLWAIETQLSGGNCEREKHPVLDRCGAPLLSPAAAVLGVLAHGCDRRFRRLVALAASRLRSHDDNRTPRRRVRSVLVDCSDHLDRIASVSLSSLRQLVRPLLGEQLADQSVQALCT